MYIKSSNNLFVYNVIIAQKQGPPCILSIPVSCETKFCMLDHVLSLNLAK